MNKPTDNQQFTGQVIINGKAVNAESLERIQACLAVCEGISTSVLELNATAGGVATLERQRDDLRAALESLILFTKPTLFNAVALNNAHQVIAKIKGVAALPELTATGTADEGASNHGELIAKLIGTPQLYTSVSKGGAYERLGAIRGAGTFKGLSGIAYRNEAGDLFIREPECFAKRMVLIKPEGGAL
jgi:hypothetical protein